MDPRRLWMMWWSGLLAAAAFVHLLRAMLGMAVTVGTVEIPLRVSWIAGPVAGALSLWLARAGRGVE